MENADEKRPITLEMLKEECKTCAGRGKYCIDFCEAYKLLENKDEELEKAGTE